VLKTVVLLDMFVEIEIQRPEFFNEQTAFTAFTAKKTAFT